MKNHRSTYILLILVLFLLAGCVHDDRYGEPDLDAYQCIEDFEANVSLKQLKEKFTLNNPNKEAYVFPVDATPDDSGDDLYVEGYVTSTDETGNIYKTIYIQDKPENPTQGFVISVDAVSTYTQFPQGYKIYIKLNGLAVGSYGGVVQLGVKMGTETGSSVSRIPEKEISRHIFRSCNTRGKIVPKIMTLAQMVSANDQYLGCLIQVENAEFDSRALCTPFAPNGLPAERKIKDASTSTARIVRNSGYASFANQMVPAGNGKFVGIYSKYNSTYQLYINKVSDLHMTSFPRLDDIVADPCSFNVTGLNKKTVAEVKQMSSGENGSQITGNFYLKVQITANDETGNLYKYVYAEDHSGGIKININKLKLFQDNRFRVGKDIYIKLKGLYVKNINGEIQLGDLYTSGGALKFGGIEEANIYKSFFDAGQPSGKVVPTERTISQLTAEDVGRWIKINDLQFININLYQSYVSNSSITNRTLIDCNGNSIVLRTSNYASFAGDELDGGKGDVYGILGVYNGTYQLWITNRLGADLDAPRCDGTIYTPLKTLFEEDFSKGLSSHWIIKNVSGPQEWKTSKQGGSNYYAIMNGYASGNSANEDWLISEEVSLEGKTKAILNFVSDVRYNGNALQVLATDNYTGNPAASTWLQLPAVLDTNAGTFGDWTSSGNISLDQFLGKKIRIAFKYTSTTSAAATWEIDDIRIKAKKRIK